MNLITMQKYKFPELQRIDVLYNNSCITFHKQDSEVYSGTYIAYV